ncbi:SpaH/EbpB family LPXTG-anchored major pilin [Corynebacterium cystitidis]|uniref:LPXTG-motif cell wall anchor domain-containing protein/fimbrial isopeptide formation D2 domain-containing protein n=1 Tax=Corynebacterium cystitidis DSM 20524 TaxID=1121357 RepID=A0A1H9SN76_9CORY|nr:SpaH/EbpB family LPXTG-anchored major pilin [Corynebacterium cystitidis]WJY83113.1 Fimbrial subunit type 1 precursor [Corynebacterium cystitidis DSM 20524]SER86462.1 LPXTG-motif cell wall anchor domain-containing protein/fimbrial isopeptide formation D2 domain-containing protein [Corynebacterium cystitidis DSM 20524]SNV66399.1 surface-anchored protein, fimbrial subunit [Corynebacterium cystitidis]
MARATTLVRSTAIAAALGMAVSLGAVGVTADATPTYGDDSPVVNPTKQGSLTIHKYGDPNSTSDPTGLDGQSVDGGKVLDGVGFTIYKINGIDVTTNEGLAAAAGIKPENYIKNGAADLSKVTKIGEERKTETNGQTTFPGLALGAYLVVETSPKEGYTPAAPFIAFVPMTEGNDNKGQGVKWFYDVHAYPKNYSETKPTKEVADKDKNVSEKVTYTVTGTVRNLVDNEKLKAFRITDTIDKALEIGKITVAIKGGQSLELGTDYTQDGTGQNIDVNFTPAGLAKLTSGAKVVMTVETTVKNDVNAGNFYKAPNEAKVYQNRPGVDQLTDDDGKPTPKVHTYWGKIKFTKTDDSADKKGLKGAEFQIVRSKDRCEDINVTDQATINANAVMGIQAGQTQAAKKFTSDDNGLVEVAGLHVNDFANNETVDADWYCLVEVKAPEGKELLPKPIPFQFVATSGADTKENRVYEINTLTRDGNVVNKADTTPLLPQTGGTGIALLVLAALGLIGGGAVYARRNTAQA